MKLSSREPLPGLATAPRASSDQLQLRPSNLTATRVLLGLHDVSPYHSANFVHVASLASHTFYKRSVVSNKVLLGLSDWSCCAERGCLGGIEDLSRVLLHYFSLVDSLFAVNADLVFNKSLDLSYLAPSLASRPT